MLQIILLRLTILPSTSARLSKTGDPGYFEHALGVVARAEGMSSVAASTGLNRENLYRTLSDDSNPRFQTVVKILDSLGLAFDVKPVADSVQTVAH